MRNGLIRFYSDQKFAREISRKGEVEVKSEVKVFVFVLICSVLSSCATIDRHVVLIYPPATDTEINDSPKEQREHQLPTMVFTIENFVDQRSNRNSVGSVRNGYGNPTAGVIPQNSVVDWVKDAIRYELSELGYIVGENSSSNYVNRSAIRIFGEIVKVETSANFLYSGSVAIVTRVSMDGELVLQKRYDGSGSSGLALAMMSESYAQTLALALEDAVRKFAADLDAIVVRRKLPGV